MYRCVVTVLFDWRFVQIDEQFRHYRCSMDLGQVEAEVLAAAEDADVQVTVRPRTEDGYLELDLTTPEAGDRTARIVTNGAEGFFLTLDGRFDLREFDWEAEGQQGVLHTLVGVAGAHLRGSSRRTSQARRLRADQEFLEVRHDGQTFRASA